MQHQDGLDCPSIEPKEPSVDGGSSLFPFPKDKRVITVAYRLPEEDQPTGQSILNDNFGTRNGGVISAVAALKKQGVQTVWVGHPALLGDVTDVSEREKIKEKMYERSQFVPVFIPQEIASSHFGDFCKGVIWPLFHYYEQHRPDSQQSSASWNGYNTVNQLFAETVASIYQEGDLIFIQDYHLMLLPSLLRKLLPNAKIGFFLHIPWPSSELYRSLPVRNQIIQGLVGADLIGFQAYAYVRHFVSACTRLLGLNITDQGVETKGGHVVKLEVFPAGIDPSICLRTLESESAQARKEELKKAFEGKKILVSRDRLEYTKGIPRKLKAFEAFLEAYPAWKGKVILYQECRPNTEVIKGKPYAELTEEVDKLVGSINGKFGTISYTPVHYLSKNLKWEDSCVLFALADGALVTPLRDGLNTTSHEFVVCQQQKMSPIILSEFAGSAHCLSGAVLVNPFDQKEIVKAICKALEMSEEQKKVRHRHNFDYVLSHDALYWITSFLKVLIQRETANETQMSMVSEPVSVSKVVEAYKKSKRRLLLLDYDGTLTPLVRLPQDAKPSDKLKEMLSLLSHHKHTDTYVVSGRDRSSLNAWLGHLPIGLSCEHGAFFRQCSKDKSSKPWQDISSELNLSWKDTIRGVFDDYSDRVPGSFVEVKEINLTWHYRNADPDFGDYMKNELVLHLNNLPGLPIDILSGKKAVEVRPQGVNKGSIVRRCLSEKEDPDDSPYDFVLCIGDDKTDEDMFEELLKHTDIPEVHSIIVEHKPSLAQYCLESQAQVNDLVQALATCE